ncbi:hypothetical protein Aab01nite_40380 [Paractinoplanes abujensis]|uniref:Uncharacterized protein n=1 Tax=Paractinoplanes abujensis TaxID=882441 RepID=A0A7W7CW32_9ACTN|nr:hypothetical protein [Actinoplanes abujensis]MBB4694338.1 hypothetical protein [Actinoplanes abujensis]GID20448.1 hypothetical protein Aab01nite_40380 [Actinoplanes abujensis]
MTEPEGSSGAGREDGALVKTDGSMRAVRAEAARGVAARAGAEAVASGVTPGVASPGSAGYA